MIKIGVMASGGGSNFETILNRIEDGLLKATCAYLVTNNSRCGAVEMAKKHSIPVYHISSVTHPDPHEYSQAMVDVVHQHQPQLVVLAGYMKKIPDELLQALPERVINVHPALLPAFGGEGLYGDRVHQAVVDSGVRVSGPTIHFVDSVYDHGKIIAQRAVPVYSHDTPAQVAARVLEQEHDLYWRVIQAFALGQVKIQNGRVHCPVV